MTIPDQPPFIDVPLHVVIQNARREPGTLFVGGQFEHVSLEEMRLKVSLVNGSSRRWVDFQTSREHRIGVVRSALFLLTIGIRFSIQHFGHVMLMANSKRSGKPFKTSSQSV
jgi:bifunctional ADP-heptose synthase (sugar kinase/adenylyltransferase)